MLLAVYRYVSRFRNLIPLWSTNNFPLSLYQCIYHSLVWALVRLDVRRFLSSARSIAAPVFSSKRLCSRTYFARRLQDDSDWERMGNPVSRQNIYLHTAAYMFINCLVYRRREDPPGGTSLTKNKEKRARCCCRLSLTTHIPARSSPSVPGSNWRS